MAGQIVTLIRRHLGSSFFQYDASLVRDGCFYAGLCLARDSGTEEDIRTCVQALEEMRWAFSKSEERIATLKWAWENRQVDEEERMWNDRMVRPDSAPAGDGSGAGYGGLGDGMMRGSDNMLRNNGAGGDGMMRSNSDGMMRNNGHSRPPRLNLIDPQPTVDAGPLTALSSDGSWHTPSTSGEVPASHHGSHHGSPISDPALLIPSAQDKASSGSGLAGMPYYDPTMFSDMNAFPPDTNTGHFSSDPQFFSAGMSAHHGHSAMPAHSMGVSHGMSGSIGMAGHGMQASSAHGSTTLPPFGAQHYDYYPHSNSSHR